MSNEPSRRRKRRRTAAGSVEPGHTASRRLSSPTPLLNSAVLAHLLDVQKTSVGAEANLPQCGQIFEPFSDTEVTGVVDRCLRAQSASFLILLLDG
jgi:hypothetical protein